VETSPAPRPRSAPMRYRSGLGYRSARPVETPSRHQAPASARPTAETSPPQPMGPKMVETRLGRATASRQKFHRRRTTLQAGRGRQATRRGSLGHPSRGSGITPEDHAGHDRTPSRPSTTGSCGQRTRSPGPPAGSTATLAVARRPIVPSPQARDVVWFSSLRPGPPAEPAEERGSTTRPHRSSRPSGPFRG